MALNGKKKFSTLVFLDFESTGLPKFEFQTKAIELCLIAVERDHFENMESHETLTSEPRVENKIRLNFYPKKTISNNCTKITGLCNDNLKNQHPFDEESYTLLTSFIRRLTPPVCLIAHNGNGFDFKLLNAEIKHLGHTLPDDLMCADSLAAFRQLLRSKPMSVLTKEPAILDDSDSSFESDDFVFDLDELAQLENEYFNSRETPEEFSTALDEDMELLCRYVSSPEFIKQERDLCTPEKCKKSKEVSAPKKSKKPTMKISQANSSEIGEEVDKDEKKVLEKRPRAKKRLNFEAVESSSKEEKTDKTQSPGNKNQTYNSPLDRLRKSENKIKFGLDSLYSLLIGGSFDNRHTAESDTIALLLLCRTCGPEFCQWIDENAKHINSISPMW